MTQHFLGILGNDDFGKKLGVLEEDHVKMLCPDLTDKAITTLAFVTQAKAAKIWLPAEMPRNRVHDILLSKEDVKRSGRSQIAECSMRAAFLFPMIRAGSDRICPVARKEAWKAGQL